MASSHHEHNDSFRLHRAKPDGAVAVFNQDGYLMAEYTPATGAIAWLRVVPAPKRDHVERKLSLEFPVTAVVQAPRKSNSKRRS
jgi:hypothetical protein